MVFWAVLAFLKPSLKAQNPKISGRSSRNAHFSSKNGPREMVKWSPSNRGVNITHKKKAATISALLCSRRGQTGRVREGGFGGHPGFDKGLFGIFLFLAVFFPLLNTAATLTGVRPTISGSLSSRFCEAVRSSHWVRRCCGVRSPLVSRQVVAMDICLLDFR